jgi:hypothetical protein
VPYFLVLSVEMTTLFVALVAAWLVDAAAVLAGKRVADSPPRAKAAAAIRPAVARWVVLRYCLDCSMYFDLLVLSVAWMYGEPHPEDSWHRARDPFASFARTNPYTSD